ncbi:hypothetical protein LCGC14_2153390, partial [marine sediment metagenome]
FDNFISGAIIKNYTTFTIIYKFDFDYGDNNHYAEITLGPSLQDNLNVSWVEFNLPDGFLPNSEDSKSNLFVRFNKTIIGTGISGPYSLDYGIDDINIDAWNDKYFILYNSSKSISNKGATDGTPELTFSSVISNGENVYVVYGIRTPYVLGYGFQKVGKSYSDSVRLIYNNNSASSIKDSAGLISTVSLNDPSLYIGLDNTTQETVLELYNMPLLFGPEINLTFALDPIIINQIKNFKGIDNNTLTIDFYFVPNRVFGSYYTDSIEISLDYWALKPDLEAEGYKISYNKDLQGIYEAFGVGSLDIYISISQVGNSSNFISYVILEQFDYMSDDHFVEMYANMPMDSDGDLDVNAIINTPHYIQITSEPFLDSQWGSSPFGLLDNSEVTVALENLPYSSLISLDGSSGDYDINYLGTQETLPVNAQNFYMIPNLALFTDAYNTDEIIYQDGYVNLYYGSSTDIRGENDYSNRIYMTYENTAVDDYKSYFSNGVPISWEDTFDITDQFLTTREIDVSGTVLYHQLFDLTNDVIDVIELADILVNVTGVYFGVQLPDNISIAHIRAIGIPYEYDLSIQGFPVGNYIDGTYSKVTTSGVTRTFDSRASDTLMNTTSNFSLEFASNGSKYIVFYVPISTVQNYAINDKLMVDY